MKTKTKKTYAVLTKDWTYTEMTGKTNTFAKGRRFLITRYAFFDNDGNFCLPHFYAYGCDEVIPAEYFAKK